MNKKLNFSGVKYFKFLISLVCITSCSIDNSQDTISETLKANDRNLITEIIPYSTVVKEVSFISDAFEKLRKSSNRNSVGEGLIINEADVKYIQDGDYHSYTFSLTPPEGVHTLGNLVFSLNAQGTYTAHFVEYAIEVSALQNIVETADLELLENKVYFTKLGEITDINEILERNSTRDPIGDCPQDLCCDIVSSISPGTGWVVQQFEVVPCDGGSSGDGGPGGPGDSGDPSDPSDNTGYNGWVGEDPANPSDGSGNGGGGSDTSDNSSSNDTPEDEDCIADEDGNCIGTTTTPVFPKGDLPDPSEQDDVAILLDIEAIEIIQNINSFMDIDLNSEITVWISSSPSNIAIAQDILEILEIDSSSQAQSRVLEIFEAAINGDLVTSSPFLKYPPNSNYEILYPKFTNILRDKMPELANDAIIVEAIHSITDAPINIIQEALQWGKGAEIRIAQLGPEKLGAYRGFTSPLDYNTLYIDIDLVNTLENIEDDQSCFSKSIELLIAVTLLHEYTHLGDFIFGESFWWNLWLDSGNDEDEVGLVFENEVFGTTLWRDNVELYVMNEGLCD